MQILPVKCKNFTSEVKNIHPHDENNKNNIKNKDPVLIQQEEMRANSCKLPLSEVKKLLAEKQQ